MQETFLERSDATAAKVMDGAGVGEKALTGNRILFRMAGYGLEILYGNRMKGRAEGEMF